MLIGIDASRANHNQRTGVEEYAYQLVQELKKITPDNVRVVLYTDKPLQGELAKLSDGWTQKVLKWPPRHLWTQIRLSLEMLFHPPDVLFTPAHVFPLIHPKKTVMMVHDIAAVRFPESYNWFERWYTLWSAKFAVKKLYKVIVPSKFTKQELISNFPTPQSGSVFVAGQFPISNNIKVIYHGYHKRYETRDKRDIEKILEKYNLQKSYLLSVGRLEEKKNTINIIKSFEKLKIDFHRYSGIPSSQREKSKIKNLKLVLAGFPGYGYKKIKHAIQFSPFKNDIIALGWVDEGDLPFLMAGAEVFVFPSLYEGFGLPVLEAMAAGVPVVASKGASLEEVGGDACLYIDPANVEEISDSVIKLLSDFQLREDFKNRGLKRVREFSWEKCARETLELLLSGS